MSIMSSTAVELSDAELRAMVRAAIDRLEPSERHERHIHETLHLHISHARLPVRGGGPGADGEDGACVIEPSVRCTHCGYCQSYGH
jgi:hypothetical protein